MRNEEQLESTFNVRSRIRNPTLVIDLDNTLFDTAVRKLELLKAHFPDQQGSFSLDRVRSDFTLRTVLDKMSVDDYDRFFEALESPDAIRNFQAPPFPGALEAIKFLQSSGYKLVALTARPEYLREVSEEELSGVDLGHVELVMPSDDVSLRERDLEKTHLIREIQRNHDVVAAIGDRPDDIRAAHANEIPGILFLSTVSDIEVRELLRRQDLGLYQTSTWTDIPGLIEQLEAGSAKMTQLRSSLEDNYGRWLSDIDSKAGICVMVAATVSALSGTLLSDALKEMEKNGWETWAALESGTLVAACILAVFALLFAIESYTSRRTSGSSAGEPIRTIFQQALSILVGRFSKTFVRPGDAISDFEELLNMPEGKQARAHIRLLFRRYGTYDPDALENLRLFELRAANYRKAYAERIASKLLRLSIILMILWIGERFVAAFIESPPVLESSSAQVNELNPGWVEDPRVPTKLPSLELPVDSTPTPTTLDASGPVELHLDPIQRISPLE